MKKVYTLPLSAVTEENVGRRPNLGRAVIRLTGVDAPRSADTLQRAGLARALSDWIELSVSEHPCTDGSEAPPPWISMVWLALWRNQDQEDSAAWRLAKELHDGLWPVGIQMPLSAGNISSLPERIGRLAAAIPKLRELRLTVDVHEDEQKLPLDELRDALQAGLGAARRATDAGWKCEVRCEGLPLCAAEERDFGFFIGRNESEQVIFFDAGDFEHENVCPPKRCPSADVCAFAPYGQCRESGAHLLWVPEAKPDIPRTAGLYALHSGDDERFYLGRYTEAVQRRSGIVMRSRLFGIEVFVPLLGAAQECFLDRLSSGMTAEEIRAFFREQRLETGLFDTMLKGCVLA